MIRMAMISKVKADRADAGTMKTAVSANAARVVSNARLKRKPAPQREGGRLSASMNRDQTMLYWARETEWHL